MGQTSPYVMLVVDIFEFLTFSFDHLIFCLIIIKEKTSQIKWATIFFFFFFFFVNTTEEKPKSA